MRQRLVRILLFLGLGALFARMLYDPDLWYHLAIGREIWQSGKLPTREFIVLPNLGQPGEFHEWGHDVLVYLIERIGGLPALTVFNAAVGLAVLACLRAAAAAGRKLPTLPAALVTVLVFWLIEFRINFRPEIVLYLALALTVLAAERARASREPRWLLAVMPATLLLTQAHPSAAMLLVVIGAYALQYLIEFGWRSPLLRAIAGVALAIPVVAMLNPYGIEQFVLPFKFAQSKEVIEDVTEFLPALATPYAIHFIVAMLLGALAIVFGERRPVDAILLLGFGFLAFRHGRNIALLALVIAVPVYRAAASWFAALRPAPARALAALAALLLAAGIHRSVISEPGYLGYGIDPATLPAGNVERLRALLPAAHVMNFYHFGGYVAWTLGADYKVMVDGRNFARNRALAVHDQVFGAAPEWRELLQAYGVNAILAPATLPYSGKPIPLVEVLATSADWKLVGSDPASLLWVRAELPGEPLPARTIAAHAAQELRLTLHANPDNIDARRLLEQMQRAAR